jgi:toxin YoeB
MGKYSVKLTSQAEKDLRQIYKSGDKNSIKRLERIFDELKENPYEGIGKPKPLKHQYIGFWSRRINKKDRLVYQVNEDIVSVFVVSVKDHYGGK